MVNICYADRTRLSASAIEREEPFGGLPVAGRLIARRHTDHGHVAHEPSVHGGEREVDPGIAKVGRMVPLRRGVVLEVEEIGVCSIREG